MIVASLIIALIVLIIGSITDLRKREVPDYLSYGLMFVTLAVSVIYSIIGWSYIPLAQSAAGFLIGVAIAYGMFYLGQWGGGDSKLIMGVGAAIGFNTFGIFGENNYWLLGFLILTIFVGAFYGLIWSIYLAIRKRREFMKSVREWSEKRHIRMIRRILLIVTLILVAVTLFIVPEDLKIPFFGVIAVAFFMFYLWIFVKIIEESCMLKRVRVSRLTEGDWIYEDVFVGKKCIAGPKDLGISREQIAQLKTYAKQKKIHSVMIKEGIPFVPVFLISFAILLILYFNNIPPAIIGLL